MVQLPLHKRFDKKKLEKIISSISDRKDVDGMKDESDYVTPTLRAVLIAMKRAQDYLNDKEDIKVVVGGSKGFIGRKIYNAFKQMQYSVVGFDEEVKKISTATADADVVISAIGENKIIKSSDVKEGVVVIDVGEPKADFDESILKKASFVTPVPGGIGPLTIACLMQNLVSATEDLIEK
jgi:methylenetetrahydrofolate dehydrogenase (NADP+)/methenyltetrahydrofolate cyclohydrolase